MGILFNSTVLGIHFCETSLIFNFKTRLGGEICLCDLNMHKGYWTTHVLSVIAKIAASPKSSSTLIVGSPVVPWVSCRYLDVSILIYVCEEDF